MDLSLYRKYRPQTFDEIVGQDHVSRTLKNAVQTGQVAHAYVFAGSRGTGKTSLAKILAKALNCVGPDAEHIVTEPTVTPCGVCESCVSIAASTSLDVIEMDAASNRGIDDIRELREKIGFAPVRGRFKVYIIDEAHMLTKEAFNALLKTLEEPPPHVVFVLATTEVHKIIPTILSRCQRFDFRRPRVHEIARLLAEIAGKEGIEIEEPALLEIARHSEGGFRDAIGTLEKLSTFFAGEIVTSREVLDLLGVIESDLLFEIVDIVIERDAAGALLFVQRLAERGVSYPQFITDLLRHLRQVFLLQHLEDVSEDAVALRALAQNLEIDESLIDRLVAQANQFAPRELLRFVDLLAQTQGTIRAGLDPRLQLELALIKVAKPGLDHSDEALEERLRRLEAGAVPIPQHHSLPLPERETAPRPRAATPSPTAATPVPDAADPSSVADPAAVSAASASKPEPAPDAAPMAQRGWETILMMLQAQDQGLHAFLRDARVRADSPTTLIVTLGSDLALTAAGQPENRELLAGVIESATGATPTVELRLDAATAAQSPAAGAAGAGTPAPAAPAHADASLTTAQMLQHLKQELNAVEISDDD